MGEKRSTAPQQLRPTDPAGASLDWIRRSIAEEVPDEDPDTITATAQNLVAIAEENHVPIEILVMWIHTTEKGKFGAATWRAYCKMYAEAIDATESD